MAKNSELKADRLYTCGGFQTHKIPSLGKIPGSKMEFKPQKLMSREIPGELIKRNLGESSVKMKSFPGTSDSSLKVKHGHLKYLRRPGEFDA